MLFNIKIIVMVASLLLGITGVALASTGVLPDVADEVATLMGIQEPESDQGVRDDAYDAVEDESGLARDDEDAIHDLFCDLYGEHGDDVSHIAKDKDATGTMTLPNGKVIEKHGLAVKEAATGHDEAVRDGMEQPPAHEASGAENCGQQEQAAANSPADCDGYEYQEPNVNQDTTSDPPPAGSQEAADGNMTDGRR